MFDEYKSKQKSKPGFSNEIEAKFLGLLENVSFHCILHHLLSSHKMEVISNN